MGRYLLCPPYLMTLEAWGVGEALSLREGPGVAKTI